MPTYLSDKHNLTATAAPGATDDRSAGYSEGTGRHNCSRWINTLTGIEYICIDATVGAARWMVNEYAGTASVAGLNAALGSAAETATRMSISENFTKRPALASSITGALVTLTDSSGWTGTHNDTLAASTAQKAGYVYYQNITAATTTGGADQLDVSGGGGAMANIVQPDVPRNIIINFTDGDASISAFQVDVVGVAPDGTATAEQFVFAGGLDQTGSVIHAKITSVTVTSITGNGAGDTLDIGYGVKLGLPLPAGSTSLGIVKLVVDGTETTASATDTTNNSFTSTVTPDGAKDFEIWYEYLDAQQSVIQQNVSNVAAKVIELVSLVNALVLANADFEVAGTNMTTALVTIDAARGGIRLTTAGANNDQAILQPRITNSNDSRWAKGFVTDQSPKWGCSFRLTAITAMSFKCALALTNAHNLTTDDDQVGVYYSSATGGNFLVITSIGGTDATIDTGVAPAAGTEYRVRVEVQSDRKAHVYLNDVRVAITGALTTAVNLIPFRSIQALGAAAKSFDIRDKDTASMEQAA